jgi:hypothetical protein
MTLIEKSSNVNKILSKVNNAKHFNNTNEKNLSTPILSLNDESVIESRRSSGNSITIRITNDNNVTVGEESLECILKENYLILNENERRRIDDDFEAEVEETSVSINSLNEHLERNLSSKKKLKERKKLVRSLAQQKHHLINQESEDQPAESVKTYNSVEALGNYDMNNNDSALGEFQSQNSAFDELFAAAKTGNFIKSAHVEAKMAQIAASQNTETNDEYERTVRLDTNKEENCEPPTEKSFFSPKGTFFNVNRNSSFRNRHSFKKVSPSDNSSKTSSSQQQPSTTQSVFSGLLGSPQQLTRSCSCKRPGSFKKMNSKSPNVIVKNAVAAPIQANAVITPPPPPPITSNVQGRRGTQCSIVFTDADLENENKNSSISFDILNSQQQDLDGDAEICRVRQFNITNKGSIINRGDSFKRSFKRSNNSLSSKKDPSPVLPNHEGNTLNLPEFQDAYINKSSNSINYGQTTTTPQETASILKLDTNSISDSNTASKTASPSNEVKTYLVYMLGASR